MHAEALAERVQEEMEEKKKEIEILEEEWKRGERTMTLDKKNSVVRRCLEKEVSAILTQEPWARQDIS
jgi:hypothetical protein